MRTYTLPPYRQQEGRKICFTEGGNALCTQDVARVDTVAAVASTQAEQATTITTLQGEQVLQAATTTALNVSTAADKEALLQLIADQEAKIADLENHDGIRCGTFQVHGSWSDA
jgi:hypothetical protein